MNIKKIIIYSSSLLALIILFFTVGKSYIFPSDSTKKNSDKNIVSDVNIDTAKLDKLIKIKLDDSIFSDPKFKNLKEPRTAPIAGITKGKKDIFKSKAQE